MGSGRWPRWGTKTTVESSLWIDANRWMREGILAADTRRSGRWIWKHGLTGEELSSIGYEVRTWDDGMGVLRLLHTNTVTRERFDYRVELQTTEPHLGGFRWWFTCPLAGPHGCACGRRCGKLYLVHRYFGCRLCQDLTYRSSQEAHQGERFARMLDRWEAETFGVGLGRAAQNRRANRSG